MKTVKFYTLVSLAALMASCSNEDLGFDKNGIESVETITEAGEVRFGFNMASTSRGYFDNVEGKFITGWNAETDRIGVVFSGVSKGYGTSSIYADDTKWCGVTNADRTSGSVTLGVELNGDGIGANGYSLYKATKSGNKGEFTAIGDVQMLQFVKDKSADFRIFRPAGATATERKSVKYSSETNSEGQEVQIVEHLNAIVADFNKQTQTEVGKANFDNFFMVSEPITFEAEKVNEILNKSVGENLIELGIERPFAALAITTEGYDYATYGNLKTITITCKDSKDEAIPVALTGATVDIAGKVDGKWEYSGTDANTIVLTLGDTDGLQWEDGEYAFAQILPINDGENTSCTMSLVLGFANGTVEFEKELNFEGAAKDMFVPNSFNKTTLKFDEQPYIYLSTTDKLIVNSQIPEVDESNKFNPLDGTDTPVDVTDVTDIVLNKSELSESEIDELKKYNKTNKLTIEGINPSDLGENFANIPASVKTLTINGKYKEGNTLPKLTGSKINSLTCSNVVTVPAETFKGNTSIYVVNLPYVTVVENNAFEGATKLTTISNNTYGKLNLGDLTSIGEYAFDGIALTKIDLSNNTASVSVADKAFGTKAITGLTEVLIPGYNYESDYNKIALLSSPNLSKVDLSGVTKLGTDYFAFEGKTNLTSVTLADDCEIGNNTFKGCTKLATVDNIASAKSIGANAFNNTAITSLTLNTATIFGESAFENCKKLAEVEFAGTNNVVIPNKFFKGCDRLTTLENEYYISEIGVSAFEDCSALKEFDFTNSPAMSEASFKNAGLANKIVYKGNAANGKVLKGNVFYGIDSKELVFTGISKVNGYALANLPDGATIAFDGSLSDFDANAFTSSKYNLILTKKNAKLTVEGNSVSGTSGNTITFRSVTILQ